jgi:hypothetical protein
MLPDPVRKGLPGNTRSVRLGSRAADRRHGRDDGLDGELTDYARHGIPPCWQDTELYRLACKHVRSMDSEGLFGWLGACAEASVQNPLNPSAGHQEQDPQGSGVTRWSDAANASGDAHLVRIAAEMQEALHGQ